jgi:signal transduction histidine kinase
VRLLPGPTQRTVVLADGMLAVGVMVIVLFGSIRAANSGFQNRGVHPLDPFAFVLMVAAAGSLVLRRVRPVWVLGATVGLCAVYLALRYPYGPMLFTMVIAMYTVATVLPPRRAAIACAAGLVPVAIGEISSFAVGHWSGQSLALQIAWVGWLLIPWLLGVVMKYGRETVRHSHEEDLRRRAYEERLRTAREVHDVVGHSLAVINLQSGVALHVLERRPDQARVALDAIRKASKDALDELRTTLAVFRRSDGWADEDERARRPASGLAQLDALVAGMADSGLSVELRVTGDRVELPAATDLAAYRIVQESLTNVLRHAGRAKACVRVEYTPDAVLIEVTDDGRGGEPVPHHSGHDATAGHGPGGPGGGLGIVGMRERAAAVGGSLAAGPGPTGGFRVHARLPRGGSEK